MQESVDTKQVEPSPSGAEVTSPRDNPLLDRIAVLSADLEEATRRGDEWEKKWKTWDDYVRTSLETAKATARFKHLPARFAKYIQWYLFVPTWLLIALGLVVVPPVSLLLGWFSAWVLWWDGAGMIVLALLLVFLNDEASRAG